MDILEYGIYERSDSIKLAYIFYQYYHHGEPWSVHLYCAECPAAFAERYDPTKKAHQSQVIRIARHKGDKGGFTMCEDTYEAYVNLELYNPITTRFWV